MAVKEKAKKETKPAKAKLERDEYGCKKGGAPYKINSAVTSTPQTVEEIAKACGEKEGRVAQHLKFWSKKGAFVEEKGKWRRSKKFTKAPSTKTPSKPSKQEKDESEE